MTGQTRLGRSNDVAMWRTSRARRHVSQHRTRWRDADASWRGLQAILWIVLLGFVALLGVSRFTPYETLVVRSGSMEPTIHTGGIVIVDREARSPKRGCRVVPGT